LEIKNIQCTHWFKSTETRQAAAWYLRVPRALASSAATPSHLPVLGIAAASKGSFAGSDPKKAKLA